MYLHERSLVKRLANQPFVLIGINSDPKARLRTAMKANNITWRSFWDGGNTSGPIAKAWGVRSWPTIYVVDDRGVIRYKGVRGKAMDTAVDTLLATATTKLTQDLSSVKPEQRGMAAYYLGSAGAKGSKNAIANLMEDTDPVVRQRAATALALLGEKTGPLLGLLRKATTDKNPLVQVASLGALGRARDTGATGVVVEALSAKNSDVLVAAIGTAGTLKASKAIGRLKSLSAHKETGVSHAAITALGQIGGKQSTAALKELAGRPRHPARVRIAAALFESGDAASGKAFQAFLSDESVSVRREAVTALASLKGLETRSLFLKAIGDDDLEVRNVARKALQGSKDAEVRKALEQANARDIEDLVPQLAVRSTARSASKQLQSLGPSAAPLLMKHMGQAKSLQAKFSLARVIAELKSPEVARLAAVELKNPKLERNSRFAFEQIATSAVKAVLPVAHELLKAESAVVRQSGLRLLLRHDSDSKAAQDVLVSALKDKDASVRVLAAYTLSKKGNKAAVPVLIEGTRSKDVLSKQYGIFGLAAYKTKASSDAIADAVLKSARLGRLGIQSLQKQGTADAARALGRVLREGTASNKATAHLALRRMKVPEAKKVLEAAGKSTD
jgi:HEAT repeat protein